MSYGIALGDSQAPIGPDYSDNFMRVLFLQIAGASDAIQYQIADFDSSRPFLLGYFSQQGIFFGQYNPTYYNAGTQTYAAPPITFGLSALHICVVW